MLWRPDSRHCAVAVARFNNTAQNPVLLNTVGLWLMYFEIPTLPQLPPSATVLRALWPRLQQYAITSKVDSLYDTCTAGAAGDEVSAKYSYCYSCRP
jgi:hypothetical protein